MARNDDLCACRWAESQLDAEVVKPLFFDKQLHTSRSCGYSRSSCTHTPASATAFRKLWHSSTSLLGERPPAKRWGCLSPIVPSSTRARGNDVSRAPEMSKDAPSFYISIFRTWSTHRARSYRYWITAHRLSTPDDQQPIGGHVTVLLEASATQEHCCKALQLSVNQETACARAIDSCVATD